MVAIISCAFDARQAETGRNVAKRNEGTQRLGDSGMFAVAREFALDSYGY